MPLYTISYDLRTTEEPLTNEQFRKLFVEFLLRNGVKSIKSYNNSTILFGCNIEFNDISKMVHRAVAGYAYYQFSEIVHTEGKNYNCVKFTDPIHVSNFNDLVEEVKDLLG